MARRPSRGKKKQSSSTARAKKASAKKKPAKKPAKASAKKPAKKPAKAAAKKPAKKSAKAAAKKLAKKPARRPAQASTAKQPTTKPVPAPPPALTPSPAVPDWRPLVRAAVEACGPDFGGYLAGLGAAGWEHADSPELAGLEQWGTELAKTDRRAGIGALVRVAQYGMPLVLERGGMGLEGMGFLASERSHDGAPVERQLQLAAAWLDAPDDGNLTAVKAGNDPSRQLQIWDEDLRPNDDRAHWWYTDVGQCAGHAITRTGGSAHGSSYYEWPPEMCVGRGLVLAVRGLREKGTNVRELFAQLREVLRA